MYIKTNPKIYYEKIGTGKPLILVHGNGENHTIFNELIDALKDSFTIYAMDTRGHGESDSVDEFHYDDFADDVVRLIECENIEKPSFFGFSDGGIVGAICAIKYGELFDRFMLAGANITVDGLYGIVRLIFATSYLFTKNKRTKMMLNEPCIPIENVGKISNPTLVLAGQFDLIKRSHTRMIANAISGSKMQIIKHHHHGSYVIHSDYLKEIIKDFCEV